MINHYYWWIQTYVFLAFATCKYIIIITIYCQHNPSTNVTFVLVVNLCTLQVLTVSILSWCHMHSSSFYSLYSITVGNYCKQETRKMTAVIISFIIYFSAFEILQQSEYSSIFTWVLSSPSVSQISSYLFPLLDFSVAFHSKDRIIYNYKTEKPHIVCSIPFLQYIQCWFR